MYTQLSITIYNIKKAFCQELNRKVAAINKLPLNTHKEKVKQQLQ